MLLPSEGNPAAIGASQNEMTIAFRALKMHNGDTITPEVTMWLEHNNVGTEYKDGISDSIVNGKNYECQGPIVDGKEAAGLPKHGAEAKTLMLDTIKITAAPRYNLKFVSSTSSQMTAAGTYDFSSGNDKALNKTAGNVYGRLTGTGIQVEIDSKEGYGMRGVELPSTDYPISFVLTLSSEYIKSNEENAGAEINAEYQPLFFSGDGNKASATSSFDGRKVNTYRGYALTVPYNTGANYNGCYNGGTWQFEAVEGKANEVKVTITGFDIKDDVKEKNLPNCYPYTNSDSPETNKQYYNPDNLKNWWEIDQAVFTAGEIWVLQPYNNSYNVYIVDRAGLEGQFKNVIQASDFCMYSAMGETVTTQTNLDDDKATDARYLKNRGNISAYISYLKNPWSGWNDALTEGCNETDNDWAVAGQPVAIRMHTAYNGNTEEYRAVATNQLIKWDDEFFEPESAASSNITYFSNKNATRLWAAKQDGTGWNSDEEMKRATIDDLKFYTSLSAMGNAVPVGILEERRGVQTDGAHNVMLFVKGKIKENCEPNKVYMTVQNSYVWRMVDIEDDVKAYYKKDVNSVSDKEYEDYMKNVFPSAVNNTKEMLDEKGGFTKDYTQPFWRQDYWFSAGKGKVSNSSMADTGACRAAAKASYDAYGHKPGNGMKFYQDSCLVVPYESTITKSVAQKEAGGSGDAKAVFDMNQNQRVIDFVLYPKIERIKGTGVSGAAQVNTIVHVTDVLPAGLTYIENSAYLGGTYTQDPTCQQEGKITGGIQEQKEAAVGQAYLQQYGITKNADGTTTIEWRFPITINANETVWTQPIRFSCRIGTPGQDATDVKDGDQLTNTVKIWSEGETVRKQCKEFGNLSECSIKIVKTGALSLSKLADQLLADLWDTMGFTMNVGNNSSAMLSNITIAETLPYNGINGSSFNGKLKVTEFSAGTEELLEHFQFYYTTEEKYKGMTSAEIKDEMQDKEFDVESGWIALELSGPSNTTFVTDDGTEFPSDVDQTKQITAIVAVGKLPANKTLKMHITFMLEGGVATDILVNTLSKDRLISSAKTSVVNRTLEGLAWKDEDGDGERDNMETPLSGVKVSLWKLNKDGIYEKVCYPKTKIPVEIETGQQVSIQASVADIKPYVGKDSTDPFVSGRYKFTELPAGTYKVMFTDGTQRIQDFIASPVNHISYENRDSDGIPHYENENNQKKLKYTKIEGIELKAAKLLDSGTGESLDHDSGFYDRGYELPSTGGIGTASFYAAGGALVFAAVVLLITRRRMDRK